MAMAATKSAKRKSPVARRAWRLLRLALLWARKGGMFRRGLMLDLRRVALRSIRGDGGRNGGRIGYLEREFSLDDSPVLSFRAASKRLAKLPCVTAPSVVDFDGDDCNGWVCLNQREFFRQQEESLSYEDEEGVMEEVEGSAEGSAEDEEGIDSRAEEFIARFYEEMKFERQVSFLEYKEMLERGAC